MVIRYLKTTGPMSIWRPLREQADHAVSAATSQHDSALRAKIDAARADRGVLVAAVLFAGGIVDGPMVKCPWHADGCPSGSIDQDDQGVGRLKCRACEWKGEKSFGDVFDVVGRALGCDVPGALEHLGLTPDDARPRGRSARQEPVQQSSTRQSDPRAGGNGSSKRDAVDRVAFAVRGHRGLLDDPAHVELIWRARAVNRKTLERHGVGVDDTGEYWSFPIRNESGAVIAVKLYRIHPDTNPKCLWASRGCGRSHLLPGELKALAVAS